MRAVISLLMAGLLLALVGCRANRCEDGAARPPRQARCCSPGQVRKILSESCIRCHNAAQKKGGLDLSRRAPALLGGKAGAVIVPGSADESLMVEKVEAGGDAAQEPAHPSRSRRSGAGSRPAHLTRLSR